ncbi:MAG: response regulator transcription factor [Acidimicrobiales bacterium]|nr:response regulator transcription factor [Acidimicrobiales bacterium]
MTAKILVVDDEPGLADLIATALKYAGFDTRVANNGYGALAEVEKERPDLVILDVMLPDVDGFELTRRWGAGGKRIPVLFLTARDSTEDKVRGLTVGGDDYVTKPFSLEEVIARVGAVLRRSGHLGGGNGRLTFGDLELDEETHEVRRGGTLIDLTITEYRLLHYFLSNPRKVLTRSQILDHVWDYDFGGDGGILETYISYLRKKVDSVEPKIIHTVRGVGYVLRVPVS